MNRFDHVKDSGERQEFDTGSVRDTQEGKGRYDLLPASAFSVLASVLEYGSKKYGERNWEKGQPISRYVNSAFRHLLQYWAGRVDEMHLQAAFWNIMCIIETEECVLSGELPKELDDHPKRINAPLLLRVVKHTVLPNNLDDCWGWDGADNGNGYGVLSVRGKKVYVHRTICQSVHGDPPDGKNVVAHSCDNRKCCNPRHLRWASTLENVVEACAKKRQRSKITEKQREFAKDLSRTCEEAAEILDITPEYVAAIRGVPTRSPYDPEPPITGRSVSNA